MEKLILRSIMYGADKIPDSWFDKVPGGFYKAKEVQKKAVAAGQEQDRRRSQRSVRRSTSGAAHTTSSNPQLASTGRRRYSTGEPLRGPLPSGDVDSEGDEDHRSGGRRRRREERHQDSSYDRVDEDFYGGGGLERRGRPATRIGRRRSKGDGDSAGLTSPLAPQQQQHQQHSARSFRPPFAQTEYIAPQRPAAAPMPLAAAPLLSTNAPSSLPSAARASTAARPPPPYVPAQTAAYTPHSLSTSTPYIPYAHLYNSPSPPRPPPTQPQARPPVCTSYSGYRQDPYAQDSSWSAASSRSAVGAASSDGHQRVLSQERFQQRYAVPFEGGSALGSERVAGQQAQPVQHGPYNYGYEEDNSNNCTTLDSHSRPHPTAPPSRPVLSSSSLSTAPPPLAAPRGLRVSRPGQGGWAGGPGLASQHDGSDLGRGRSLHRHRLQDTEFRDGGTSDGRSGGAVQGGAGYYDPKD
ncbi:hypothetical protein B0A50_07754 [Salinomyces thailandicus]|uniref:Uncharacterized protein n=1 Tax=Salinomyces thailandicus TaxID=706561 RepID=A0A4U0TLS2_9PEZI|nr:hypothetical protein B0A50_07754 [Salinomyces thailandica]